MAGSDPQAGDGAANDNRPLQQPTDAVPMKEITKEEEEETAQSQPEGGSSLPAGDAPRTEGDPDAQPPTTDAGTPSVKGKDKEETITAPAERRDDNDLSISPVPVDAVPDQPATSPDHPVCNITLLLPSGARHPYKLDERYLEKRNVDVPDLTEAGKKDPFSISVYTLKELILREWRDEWENRPASPTSIRLIHFGKLLDDKEQLKKYQFSTENPNVVHMSVRPAEMIEEDEAAKGKTASKEGRSDNAGGCCCVIL